MHAPPKIAKWLLILIISRSRHYSYFGDLEEMYNYKAEIKNTISAKIWYWGQVAKEIPIYIKNMFYWSAVMFNSYFKIAFRNMKKYKAYSLINISGLAVGIVCCILIFSYVFYDLSFDKYHKNADNIYRIGLEAEISGQHVKSVTSNVPTGPTLVENYPEVVDVVRFWVVEKLPVKHKDLQFTEDKIFYAEESVFDIFSFNMLQGDPESALSRPYSVVITKEISEKYFGDEDPLGKTLTVNVKDNYTVTGVVERPPSNSHFTFEILLSFETLFARDGERIKRWVPFNTYTYILLQDGYNPKDLEAKLPGFIEANMGQIVKAIGGKVYFYLQPLTSIHLHSNFEAELSGNSDIAYIYLFSVVAILILTLACINFMNLSTARSSNRAREIGLRKVLGAERSKLIKQFIGESVVFSLLALSAALVIVKAILPYFNSISGSEINLDYFSVPWMLPAFIACAILIGILAGYYPALFLSSFQPVKVLTNNILRGKENRSFRGFLVIFQFVISISLIIGSGIIKDQLTFMKNKKLGFTKDQILVIPSNTRTTTGSVETIKNELLAYKNIKNVSASSKMFGEIPDLDVYVPEGHTRDNTVMMRSVTVDENFISMFDMEIISGRKFSAEHETDANNAILINETALKLLDWENPIGKTIQDYSTNEFTETDTKTVIGVVKDFHFNSLHKKIEPFIIHYRPNDLYSFAVKVDTEDLEGIINYLEQKWKAFDPDRPMNFYFLDESFDNQYKADEKLTSIFTYFTYLAIFIACLGLTGLASYMIEVRRKEVGIRKTLGSSVSAIFILMNREMMIMLIVSNLISWPLSYFLLNKWIQNFPYRVEIGFSTFILSAGIVFIIAFITVGYQIMKAAYANPVNSLRNE